MASTPLGLSQPNILICHFLDCEIYLDLRLRQLAGSAGTETQATCQIITMADIIFSGKERGMRNAGIVLYSTECTCGESWQLHVRRHGYPLLFGLGVRINKWNRHIYTAPLHFSPWLPF